MLYTSSIWYLKIVFLSMKVKLIQTVTFEIRLNSLLLLLKRCCKKFCIVNEAYFFNLRHCYFPNMLIFLYAYFLQNGVISSIKLQQVTFVVPGVENFDHSEILMFIQRAKSLLVSCCCVSFLLEKFVTPYSYYSYFRILHCLSTHGWSFWKRRKL